MTTKDTALRLALEALGRAKNYDPVIARAITACREALAQPAAREPVIGTKSWFDGEKVITQNLTASDIYKPEQPTGERGELVAYDKKELNCFAQDLYDQKMQEGKHGHYETMFHVIHQCIKRVIETHHQSAQSSEWIGLSQDEIFSIAAYGNEGNSFGDLHWQDDTFCFVKAIEAKLKEKNNGK